MTDTLKRASVILEQWCAHCQRAADCDIKRDGESQSVIDFGLPEAWADDDCTAFLAVDKDTGDLFGGDA